MHKKNKAFTLIEIVTCISILAIVSLFIVIMYSESLKKGRDSQRKLDINNISSAFEAYYYDSGRYPRVEEFNTDGTLCNFDEECTRIYMEKIPKDPSSKKSYFYETDENGRHYVLYSAIENVNDKGNGVKQEGYQGYCDPFPCRYAKASTNIDVETYIASTLPMVSSQSKKETMTLTATPIPTPITTVAPSSTMEIVLTTTSTPSITSVQSPTPVPSPEVLINQDYFDITYDGLSSNIYYPMFKYQTFDLRCPKGYGVRDIRVKNKDTSRKDVKFMGCSFNEWSFRNDYGAACAFAADSPFQGKLIITCDKAYFNLTSLTPSQISNTNIDILPPLFHLGEWMGQMTDKINDQQQGLSVSCPVGYKATNITCTTHFINYTLFNILYQIEGLISMEVDSVRTASCKYDAKNSFTATVSTICEKQ